MIRPIRGRTLLSPFRPNRQLLFALRTKNKFRFPPEPMGASPGFAFCEPLGASPGSCEAANQAQRTEHQAPRTTDQKCVNHERKMTEEEKQQRWIAAWRVAGPELNRIREEELRQKDEQFGLASLGAYVRDNSEINGLITFQSWMMRLRVIELNKRLLSK